MRVVNLRRIERDHRTADAVHAAVEDFEPQAVCLCLGGNFHNVIGLLENPKPFAVGAGGFGVIPDTGARTLIPNALMRALFLQKAQPELTSQLFAIFPNALRLMLNAPPPVADFEHIRKNPGAFAERIDQGPAPAELRLHLYHLQSDVYREIALEQRAKFIEPPGHLFDETGFLAPQFVNDDPTHGNAEYGGEMLTEIQAAMGGVPA